MRPIFVDTQRVRTLRLAADLDLPRLDVETGSYVAATDRQPIE
jgi:hypothetical protein